MTSSESGGIVRTRSLDPNSKNDKPCPILMEVVVQAIPKDPQHQSQRLFNQVFLPRSFSPLKNPRLAHPLLPQVQAEMSDLAIPYRSFFKCLPAHLAEEVIPSLLPIGATNMWHWQTAKRAWSKYGGSTVWQTYLVCFHLQLLQPPILHVRL
jgi:hypothetical protein